MARIRGTNGADRITGTYFHDVIYSRGGDDVIAGGGQSGDKLDAGPGNDTIYGGEGSDWIAGQAGNDALFGDSNYGDLYVYGGGDDRLYGGPGDDYLDGGAGNDRLSGNAGNDWLTDDIGNNRMFGGADNDHIDGGGFMSGGAGDDVLVNSIWAPWVDMQGDAGADTFQVELVDVYVQSTIRVLDFDPAQGDHLQVHATAGLQMDSSHLYDGRGVVAFASFDENHSGRLGDGDTFAVADSQGHINLQWWNATLILPQSAATPDAWL